MFLNNLKLNHFRCYEKVDLCFNQSINFIDGLNGSGKTALLEAIYWQSTGRSFRHHKPVDLILHNSKEMSVYCAYKHENYTKEQKLGISYQRNKQKKIRLNSEDIYKQTDIAHHFPVIAIDPDAYLWVDQSPQFRRSFLDWLVFHVEPNYLSVWKKTLRVQKQINELLKKQQHNQIDLWLDRYIELAELTNTYRIKVFEKFKDLVLDKIQYFLPEFKKFSIDFYQGWQNNSLTDQLSQDRNRNFRLGHLVNGIHKSDIHCYINNKPINVVFSRGQKKTLSLLLYICFIELFQEQIGLKPIICIDDLDSELDHQKLDILSQTILNSEWQVFISLVNAAHLKDKFSNSTVFHVKQNKVQSTIKRIT